MSGSSVLSWRFPEEADPPVFSGSQDLTRDSPVLKIQG